MSELDRLSPLALHALRVSCAQSNVPVQLDDPATIERITALLRTTSTANPTRATDRPLIESIQLKNRRRRQTSRRGELLPVTTTAAEPTAQQSTKRQRGNPSPGSAVQHAARVEHSKRSGPHPPHADDENPSEVLLTG